MLSKDAIADVVEVLRPATSTARPTSSSTTPILDLYGRGEPADARHRLRRADPDGPAAARRRAAYLHTLISTVPTAANAGYYAQIVAERAVLRRLVDGRHPDRPDGLRHRQRARAASWAASTTSSTARRPRSTRSPSGAPARTTSASRRCCRRTLDEIERIIGHGRCRHRDPDRLQPPRRDHQRPARRADDHRRRPARVAASRRWPWTSRGRPRSSTASRRSSSPSRWASSRS